jgi:hypothetical protein
VTATRPPEPLQERMIFVGPKAERRFGHAFGIPRFSWLAPGRRHARAADRRAHCADTATATSHGGPRRTVPLKIMRFARRSSTLGISSTTSAPTPGMSIWTPTTPALVMATRTCRTSDRLTTSTFHLPSAPLRTPHLHRANAARRLSSSHTPGGVWPGSPGR